MSTDLTPTRLASLRESLIRKEVDALLVAGPENRRYLSGFTADDPHCGILLISRERALLLTDFRYREWAENEARDFEVAVYQQQGKTLMELLKDLRVSRLGFEAAHLTYRQYQRFTESATDAGLQVQWRPLEGLVEELREVKQDHELDAIRRALKLTETILRQVAGQLAPGLTERQVAWEIEKRLREGGSEGVAFPPIVAAGPNSARPHHHPGDYPLKPGEPIIIDMGARADGYAADMTRTLILGEPDDRFREIYSLVRRARERAEQGLKAGMDTLAGDALAREVISQAGYGEAFGHSLGHGVGLAVHEAPSLSPFKDPAAILKAGSVVTVEPGIYLTGWGGVRLENMALLTEDGAEVLNKDLEFYEW